MQSSFPRTQPYCTKSCLVASVPIAPTPGSQRSRWACGRRRERGREFSYSAAGARYEMPRAEPAATESAAEQLEPLLDGSNDESVGAEESQGGSSDCEKVDGRQTDCVWSASRNHGRRLCDAATMTSAQRVSPSSTPVHCAVSRPAVYGRPRRPHHPAAGVKDQGDAGCTMAT
jgi:hypothetical protein